MSSKLIREISIVHSGNINLNHVGKVNCMAVTMSDMGIGERVNSQGERSMEYVERRQRGIMWRENADETLQKLYRTISGPVLPFTTEV